jgi:hypothetical protein
MVVEVIMFKIHNFSLLTQYIPMSIIFKRVGEERPYPIWLDFKIPT